MSSLPPEVNANNPLDKYVSEQPIGQVGSGLDSGTLIGVVEADVKKGWAKAHVVATAVLSHVQTVARSIGWGAIATLAWKVAQHII